jgi:hypothetical protein
MGSLLVPVANYKSAKISLITGLISVIPLLSMVVLFFMIDNHFKEIQGFLCFIIPFTEITAVIAISTGIVSLASLKKTSVVIKVYSLMGLFLGIQGVTSVIWFPLISVYYWSTPH